MGIGGTIFLSKKKSKGGDVSEHDFSNNLHSNNKMNVCGYVME